MTDLHGLREQILANAKLIIYPSIGLRTTAASSASLPCMESNATLVNQATANAGVGVMPDDKPDHLEAVVFGDGNTFTGAVMIGTIPVIEAAPAGTLEGAIRKLLLATAELLNVFMPKLGSHQRAIHGGGVFDEDLIGRNLAEAPRKTCQ